jgi:Flp pilus assembly pilin Flp
MNFATQFENVRTYLEARLDVRSEKGQTMAEYAVVLAVITLVVIGAIQLLGGNISSAVSRVAGYIQ